MSEVAALLEQAQNALAFERERADTAEEELAALADRLGAAVRAAAEAERERAGTALAEARQILANFLARYGDSEIPAFMVAQDLANSLRRVLGTPGGEEAPGA